MALKAGKGKNRLFAGREKKKSQGFHHVRKERRWSHLLLHLLFCGKLCSSKSTGRTHPWCLSKNWDRYQEQINQINKNRYLERSLFSFHVESRDKLQPSAERCDTKSTSNGKRIPQELNSHSSANPLPRSLPLIQEQSV